MATIPAAEMHPGIAPIPPITDDAVITVPSFQLPMSTYASPEARASLVTRMRRQIMAPIAGADAPDIVRQREMSNRGLKISMDAFASRYPCTSSRADVGHVPTETFIPAAGIATANSDRVLISLHGGGFNQGGGGVGGAVEAIPFACLGRIKVIAVDYRLLPEHTLEDAVEDALIVYRDVLESYPAENIGIFGCSAGGALTSWTTAALMRKKLPLPGAIGIFCASLRGFFEGDSGQLWPRLGSVVRTLAPADGRAEPPNPLSATQDEQREFPPTLFLTGTRAFDMSGAVQSHLDLHMAGVDSQLLLFDGMDHGFFIFGHSLSETRRAHEAIVRFFAVNLGADRAR
jgi:monoterpene epsilon-lactone hydrolase